MNNQQSKISPSILIRLFIILIFVSFLPLLVSWRWDWWEGWAFAMISIASFAVGRGLLARRYPDLAAERAHFEWHKDAKPWDKILAPLLAFGGILISVVAGLDARFGWSPGLGFPVQIIALVIILTASVVASWALIENRFFSHIVRIQTDRNQQVVSSGPYRWMRHPGYAGTFWYYLALPFFLNSLWALPPAVFLMIAVVIRTSLEDRVLQDELEGYRDYAQRVRYRLVPGIW